MVGHASLSILPGRSGSGSRAALYARVSSEQQAQQNTIASQLEALKQRIQDDGLMLEEELCFVDEGYSGSTLLRPSLERLRDLAGAGGLDRLYVHSPDRLARKYAYQVLVIDELRHCGVEVIFLNRSIGSSPEDDLLLQVQGMVAEYERAKILERSRRGKRHAAHRGSVNVLSGAPYGYRYVTEHEGNGEASYQIRLEEAHVVRQTFQWVGQERLSIAEVCRRLTQQSIPSPRGKSFWDRSTVWGILKNPAYKGSAAFGKTRIGERRPRLRPYRGQAEQPRRAYGVYDVPSEEWLRIPVPSIVSEALFDTVGEQLAENRARRRETKRGARYLLQGLLACGCCGHAFYGKPISLKARKGKHRDYAYYRCIGMDAHRFGGQRICTNRQVRTDMIEEAVWSDVCGLLNEPERLEREYDRRLRKDGDQAGSAEHPSLTALTQRVQRGIARLIDAYEDGLIEKAEFEPRMKTARARLEKLQSEAQALNDEQAQQQQLRLVIGQMQEFAGRIKDGLQQADWTTRRDVIRTLVKRVEVNQENVRVVYRVSPPPRSDRPHGGVLQDCRRGDCNPLRRRSRPERRWRCRPGRRDRCRTGQCRTRPGRRFRCSPRLPERRPSRRCCRYPGRRRTRR